MKRLDIKLRYEVLWLSSWDAEGISGQRSWKSGTCRNVMLRRCEVATCLGVSLSCPFARWYACQARPRQYLVQWIACMSRKHMTCPRRDVEDGVSADDLALAAQTAPSALISYLWHLQLAWCRNHQSCWLACWMAVCACPDRNYVTGCLTHTPCHKCMRYIAALKSQPVHHDVCRARHKPLYVQHFFLGQLGKLAPHYRWGLSSEQERMALQIFASDTSLPAHQGHQQPFSQCCCRLCVSTVAYTFHVVSSCLGTACFRAVTIPVASSMLEWFQRHYTRMGLILLVRIVRNYVACYAP